MHSCGTFVLSPMYKSFYSVCMSVQAFWHLEHERVVRSGSQEGGGHLLRPWNDGKTMVLIVERWIPRGTCHVPPHQPLEKSFSQSCRSSQWEDTTQILWTDSHYGWECTNMVAGAERDRQDLSEGKTSLYVGSSKFVKF